MLTFCNYLLLWIIHKHITYGESSFQPSYLPRKLRLTAESCTLGHRFLEYLFYLYWLWVTYMPLISFRKYWKCVYTMDAYIHTCAYIHIYAYMYMFIDAWIYIFLYTCIHVNWSYIFSVTVWKGVYITQWYAIGYLMWKLP